MINFIYFNRIVISLIPLTLIFSIFVADLFVVLSSISLLAVIIFKKKINILNTKEFKFFILFYILCILGAIFSNYTNEILMKSLALIRFGLLLVVINFLIKNDKKFLKYLTNILIISFSILFIGILLQMINIEPLILKKPFARYTSFFGEESVLGGYLIRFLPIVIGLMIVNKISKNYIMVIFIISSIMIILSGERSALLLLVLFLIISLLFINKIEIKLKILTIFMFFLTVISLSIFNDTFKNRIVYQTMYQLNLIHTDKNYLELYLKKNLKNHNVSSEVIAIAKEEYFIPLKYYLMFSSSIKIFRDNVTLGSGFKTYRFICKDKRYYKNKNYLAFDKRPNKPYPGFTNVDNCSTHPHNYYLQLLSETGLFTFLIVISIFFYSVIDFFKRKELHLKFFNIAIIINLWPIIPTGSIFNNFICIILFICLGLNFKNEKM